MALFLRHACGQRGSWCGLVALATALLVLRRRQFTFCPG